MKAVESLLPIAVAAALAGCTTSVPPPPIPFSAATAAGNYQARSFRDEGLHRFLAENLGQEPPTPWNFETLCWVAFYFHPSLGVARAQWATARAAQLTAAQRTNPTITLAPGYNTTREPGISPWFPAINFDFLLPTNGKGALQQDIARADAEVARLAVETAVWRVRSDLRSALIGAALSARRATSLQAQTDVQRELLSVLNDRFAAGSIAAADVTITRSALLRAEAAAADAQSLALGSRARVAAALGLPVTALAGMTLPVPPTLSALAPEALSAAEGESLKSRSDILAGLAKYKSAQAALELEVAKQMPDVHLGPGYQWDQGGNKWSLSLTFELPLFHRNEASIAEATARRAEAAAQFILVQAQAIAAIESAVAAQTAAAGQVDRARRIYAEAHQQSLLARQRVELGAADQLEQQMARLDEVTAETAVLDAESAAAVAAGQLEDALQVPFPRLAALADPARANPSPTP